MAPDDLVPRPSYCVALSVTSHTTALWKGHQEDTRLVAGRAEKGTAALG